MFQNQNQNQNQIKSKSKRVMFLALEICFFDLLII